MLSVCTRTSERSPSEGESRLVDAAVERRPAAAGGVDRRLHARVDLAGLHDPGALGTRDGAAERAVADVGDELAQWPGRVLCRLGLVLGGPGLLVLVDALGIAHTGEHTGARDQRARAVRAALSHDICLGHVSSVVRERNDRESAQGLSPGDRRGVAARVDRAARRRDPARPLAKARDRRGRRLDRPRRGARGHASAHQRGQAGACRAGRGRQGACPEGQPRADHQAAGAAHGRRRGDCCRRRTRRSPNASTRARSS